MKVEGPSGRSFDLVPALIGRSGTDSWVLPAWWEGRGGPFWLEGIMVPKMAKLVGYVKISWLLSASHHGATIQPEWIRRWRKAGLAVPCWNRGWSLHETCEKVILLGDNLR